MNEDNRWIWRASAFENKYDRPRVLCRVQRFQWRSISALVERVMLDRGQLVVVVLAAGRDPRCPTEHDVTNAEITALVVSRQRPFRRLRPMRVYLEYGGPVLVEIEIEIESIAERVRAERVARVGGNEHAAQTPSPILSFLLGRRLED